MAFKQPKVPEYRSGERTEEKLRRLILFLKDFCQEAWTASRNTDRGLAGISYPVTSVNGQTGDVTLAAKDVDALAWNATAANAEAFDGKTWTDMLKTIYPVGAIYLCAEPTSPAARFGGTWEQIEDRFLLGAGSTYANGETGGAATVTLTTSQIPAHNHTAGTLTGSLNIRGKDDAGMYGSTSTASGVFTAKKWSTSAYVIGRESGTQSNVAYGFAFSAKPTINSTGGGGSHDNMPPYLTVYMWKRVS